MDNFKEASQSNMMDLEIADYERTVEALNNTIAEKEKLLEENKTEIDTLEDRVKTLKEQIGESWPSNTKCLNI